MVRQKGLEKCSLGIFFSNFFQLRKAVRSTHDLLLVGVLDSESMSPMVKTIQFFRGWKIRNLRRLGDEK